MFQKTIQTHISVEKNVEEKKMQKFLNFSHKTWRETFQISDIWKMPPKQAGKAGRKGKVVKEEEVVLLGPKVADGENVFGVAHIFASFNDTFIHVTDYSGKVCHFELDFTGHEPF